MKEIIHEDEKATLKTVVNFLEKCKKEPEKYMPRCILCKNKRSYILLGIQIEGLTQTAFVGVCNECYPEGTEFTEELLAKIKEKLKETVESGERTIKFTQKNWVQ